MPLSPHGITWTTFPSQWYNQHPSLSVYTTDRPDPGQPLRCVSMETALFQVEEMDADHIRSRDGLGSKERPNEWNLS